ncbi:TerD family protein [Streptomyces montanus]|uniref:TerD family protein n=1 Tax=Streptomyces montanus TaxID=2580423 RepID=A0A5R9FPI9_9ACTN|nr:TerD family protein [Streptomyces montanus]TLS42444.1 TerD family protein [Streptomyces montanus]
MTQMAKGGNVPVPVEALQAAVTWQQGPDVPDVDVSALLLDGTGRVRSDADLVFYNQREHPSRAVRHLGKGQGPGGTAADWIWLDLAAVEAQVDRVVVAASADAGTFGQIPMLDIRVGLPAGQPVASFSIGDATTETAFVFGEFYRRNGGWKFRAVGQGYDSGLAGLATDFGIAVEETPAPQGPPPPPPMPVAPPPAPAPPPPAFTPAPLSQAQGQGQWPGQMQGLSQTQGQIQGQGQGQGQGILADLAVGFAPFVHQGSGKQRVTCPPSLPPGCRVVVEIECRDSISVTLYTCDEYGRTDELLLDAYEDEVHGRTVTTVPGDRPLSLSVEADTPWILRVLPLGHARRLEHTLHGRGPDLLVYEGQPGVLSFTHQGESNFTVWYHCSSTDPHWPEDEQELLVNEVGRLDVLAPVQRPGLLRVGADGPWRIAVGG